MESSYDVACIWDFQNRGRFRNESRRIIVGERNIGFANADLLQDTNWEKVKVNHKKATPMLPKWVWKHDPEVFAQVNYEKAILSIENDVPWQFDESIPPNYLPGYMFEPWSIERIIENKKNGRETVLGTGDWS
jgi:hypothetical protein